MTRAIAPTSVALLLICLCTAARAGDYYYDFSGPYLRRQDGITRGPGNGKAVNTVTHMIDPWPRHVRDRHIPGDANRMVGAVERYRNPGRGLLPTLEHPTSIKGGSGGGSASPAPSPSSATGQ
jgi:hypothetical protein